MIQAELRFKMLCLILQLFVVLVQVSKVDLCEANTYPHCHSWGPCSRTCGGGERSRICESCYLYQDKRFYEKCAEMCFFNHPFYSGSCHCPSYRYGECCESCRHIYIANCMPGQQSCGGSPDGIMCTKCYDPYYSAGYNQGCRECTQIANCKRRHCTNNNDQVCDECVQDNVLYKKWNSGRLCERNNDCDFDNGTLCGWTQSKNDDFDWTLESGPTLSKGPKNDHTMNTAEGKYFCIESAIRKVGQYANLVSSVLSARQSTCFEFWNFMYGDGIGHLVVYIQDQLVTNMTEIYRKIGDHGNQWNKDSISIDGTRVPNDYKIVVQATVGTSLADISIDDLSTKAGPCKVSNDVPEATTTTSRTRSTTTSPTVQIKFSTGKNDCAFDSGNLCGWTQLENDHFNWTLLSGPTLSMGPTNDHTRNAADGKYLCIESETHKLGEFANLASSVLPASQTTCFEFWNFMYGNGIGSLYVFMQDQRSLNMTEIYRKSGDHGNQWNKDSISIDGTQIPHDYRLVIRADIGATPRGDISIDDLSTREGPCTG